MTPTHPYVVCRTGTQTICTHSSCQQAALRFTDRHGHPYETDLLGLLDQYHNHEGGQA